MSIGSITPTASVLAALGTAQAAGGPGGAAGSDPGLFTALLKSELETVASELQAATGAAGTSHAEIALAPAPAASTAVAGVSVPAAPAPSAPASAPAPSAATVTGATASTAPPPPAPQGHHLYVVTYMHGATPVSTGPTPAPLVKGPTGHLVLTAKTTGLTQLTPRFTGTVAHPTAAAAATPSVVASIAYLKAHGQA